MHRPSTQTMTTQPLDNPVWSSLTTQHASFAVMHESAGALSAAGCAFRRGGEGRWGLRCASREDRERRGIRVSGRRGTGAREGAGWWSTPASFRNWCALSARPCGRGPEPSELTERNRSDMLALTALVFPGFFRARTIEMGRYIGIYHGRVLAAMAGERMRLDGYQEISGVCTHPEFLGRGLCAAARCADDERGSRARSHAVPARSSREHAGAVALRAPGGIACARSWGCGLGRANDRAKASGAR